MLVIGKLRIKLKKLKESQARFGNSDQEKNKKYAVIVHIDETV